MSGTPVALGLQATKKTTQPVTETLFERLQACQNASRALTKPRSPRLVLLRCAAPRDMLRFKESAVEAPGPSRDRRALWALTSCPLGGLGPRQDAPQLRSRGVGRSRTIGRSRAVAAPFKRGEGCRSLGRSRAVTGRGELCLSVGRSRTVTAGRGETCLGTRGEAWSGLGGDCWRSRVGRGDACRICRDSWLLDLRKAAAFIVSPGKGGTKAGKEIDQDTRCGKGGAPPNSLSL